MARDRCRTNHLPLCLFLASRETKTRHAFRLQNQIHPQWRPAEIPGPTTPKRTAEPKPQVRLRNAAGTPAGTTSRKRGSPTTEARAGARPKGAPAEKTGSRRRGRERSCCGKLPPTPPASDCQRRHSDRSSRTSLVAAATGRPARQAAAAGTPLLERKCNLEGLQTRLRHL